MKGKSKQKQATKSRCARATGSEPMCEHGTFLEYGTCVFCENEQARAALREIKLTCLTAMNGSVRASAHIVRLCIDAGITQKLDELQAPNNEVRGG